MELLDTVFYGNELRVWLLALVVAVVTLLLVQFLKRIIRKRAEAIASKTDTPVDNMVVEMLQETRFFFVLLLALYLGSLLLTLPGEVQQIINITLIIALIVQGALWGHRLVTFWLTRYRREKIEDQQSATAIAALALIGKIAVWSIAVLLILDNLGVEITALVASLGIGAVAIGLAVQNILGDLLASLSILLDKPFKIGDFIIVGDYMGSVEKVGIQTTRVRSLTGEQLIFSNNDLVESRIRNYKRMEERRISFTIGAIYETPYDKLKAIPQMLQEAVEAQDQVRFDRAHFKEFGDFSLNFEIVYYVLSADYNIYMDIQQAMNLHIFRRFEEEGIEFAYPTRTLHITQFAGDFAPDGQEEREPSLQPASSNSKE